MMDLQSQGLIQERQWSGPLTLVSALRPRCGGGCFRSGQPSPLTVAPHLLPSLRRLVSDKPEVQKLWPLISWLF